MANRADPDATSRAIEKLRDSYALLRLVGQSASFLRAIAPIESLAKGDASVVISSETGTGKELVARALHYAGPRASRPFVAVNCGSLPDTLLEDQLFGHERGAFTDAKFARDGLLAQAEGGTLFLDEVDSLTPRAQVSLLRVLQEKTYRKLGSSLERRADVRFTAATNIGLRTLVRDGAFRSDLYYRLCVLEIGLPPLRERRDDVLLLARHFLAKHTTPGELTHELSPAAERALVTHDWPGNVRELENVILRARALATSRRIALDDLGMHGQPTDAGLPQAADLADVKTFVPPTFSDAKRAVVDAFEVDYLTRLLRLHGGNVSGAARTAQKERHDLRRLLKKHHLDRERFIDVDGVKDIPPTHLD